MLRIASPVGLRIALPRRVAFLVALGLALALGPAGCLSTALQERCRIQERMEPEGYLAGEDGSIAILARTSYYVPAGLMLPERAVGPPPGSVYVILSPKRVKAEIEPQLASRAMRTTDTLAAPIEIRSVALDFDYAPVLLERKGPEVSPWGDLRVVPAAFRTPGATPEDLPTELRGPTATLRPMTEPLSYPSSKGIVTLDLAKTRIGSARSRSTIHRALLIPVAILDLPVGAAVGVVGGVIGVCFYTVAILVSIPFMVEQ